MWNVSSGILSTRLVTGGLRESSQKADLSPQTERRICVMQRRGRSTKHTPLPCRLWSLLVKRYERNYEDRLKNWALCVLPLRSLEVIGIDTDPSATYDFLLVIHSNHGSMLYRFQDLAIYWPKIVSFS